MKFTALFVIASAVTFVSASPAPAAAPEPAALMSEESISKVPRSELLPRQACRGTNCSGCVNGRNSVQKLQQRANYRID
ncbi:hypothetical protein BKA59DRAFT_517006 [Fusarium tricinctum]|uniref:Uncharacterized protein n=1 Tax=Fusarium tricinctum TaxID=61284 RepID=A0A8K0W7J7_9HYPO|nr:hypothetical protein BKA59DRAFT_517006 [Fusarium tricinctum]